MKIKILRHNKKFKDLSNIQKIGRILKWMLFAIIAMICLSFVIDFCTNGTKVAKENGIKRTLINQDGFSQGTYIGKYQHDFTYTAVKNNKLYVIVVKKNKLEKELVDFGNNNKLSILTKMQLIKSFGSDKIKFKDNKVVLDHKTYVPEYYGYSKSVKRLIPEKSDEKSISVKPMNMFIVEDYQLKYLKKHNININKMNLASVSFDKDSSHYIFIEDNDIVVYNIKKTDNDMIVKRGHFKNNSSANIKNKNEVSK